LDNKDIESNTNKNLKKLKGNIDSDSNYDIDETKKSNEEFYMENNNIFTENILIFANENEDLIMKWIAVFNYLMKKEN
jgi:hypothetical protein